jgi:hypothetical protein
MLGDHSVDGRVSASVTAARPRDRRVTARAA